MVIIDFLTPLSPIIFSNFFSKIITNKETKEKENIALFINKCKIFKENYLDQMEKINRKYIETKQENLKNKYLEIFKNSLNYLKELYADFDLEKSILYKNTLYCAQSIYYKIIEEHMQAGNTFVSAFFPENLFSFIYLLNNQIKEDDTIQNQRNSNFFLDRLEDGNNFFYSQINNEKLLMLKKTLKDYGLNIKKNNKKTNDKMINEIIKNIALKNIYYLDKYKDWLPTVKMSKKETIRLFKNSNKNKHN